MAMTGAILTSSVSPGRPGLPDTRGTARTEREQIVESRCFGHGRLGWADGRGIDTGGRRPLVAHRTPRIPGTSSPADSEIVSAGHPDSAAPLYVTRSDGQDADIFRLEQTGGTWHAIPHEGCPTR